MKRFPILLLSILPCSLAIADDATPESPNILFIAVDDLRPELGCYGIDHMVTPNLDKLAATGTIFDRAYCNVAVCGASRASLMSGIRPTTDRYVRHTARHDKQAPDVPGLAETLQDNGYYTISDGKVYHYRDDTKEGWSEDPWFPDLPYLHYMIPENRKISAREGVRGPAYEAAEVPDTAYHDGLIAEKAINDLHRLKQMEQPFFLAVGFIRPHLPFNAPKKYWDLYDRQSIATADNPFLPINAPDESFYAWGEMRQYYGIPKEGPVSEDLAVTLRHGYYASTSYIDAQVGIVIDTMERLGMADNTIIVLWGDHGWQLGEHSYWCKHTNFEVAVKVPLLIRDPRQQSGQRVQSLVEYVDIYPTLMELVGIKQPDHLQGMSVAPLLENPEAPWKDAVFSRYWNGESIRTDRYRYTAFIKDGKFLSHMLYDHSADPHENINIVDLPGMEQTVDSLRQRLLDHIANRR